MGGGPVPERREGVRKGVGRVGGGGLDGKRNEILMRGDWEEGSLGVLL